MKDIPYLVKHGVEMCRIFDKALIVEEEEVVSYAPCRRARAGLWEACPTIVERFMVNPEYIASLRPSLRDAFLSSCATDSRGNAWTPKWCLRHSREVLNQKTDELDLWHDQPKPTPTTS